MLNLLPLLTLLPLLPLPAPCLYAGDALVCGDSIASAGGMDRVRPLMGVCPQFDVLWEQLTGEEHLLLFAAIKGGWVGGWAGGRAAGGWVGSPGGGFLMEAAAWQAVGQVCTQLAGCNPLWQHNCALLPTLGLRAGLPASERRGDAARLLEDVKLTEAGGVRAGSYSGGMRRRLSVAIALLGDPQVGGLQLDG